MDMQPPTIMDESVKQVACRARILTILREVGQIEGPGELMRKIGNFPGSISGPLIREMIASGELIEGDERPIKMVERSFLVDLERLDEGDLELAQFSPQELLAYAQELLSERTEHLQSLAWLRAQRARQQDALKELTWDLAIVQDRLRDSERSQLIERVTRTRLI